MSGFPSLRYHYPPLPDAQCHENSCLKYCVQCFSYFRLQGIFNLCYSMLTRSTNQCDFFLKVWNLPVIFEFIWSDNILVLVIWDGTFQSIAFFPQTKIPLHLSMFRILKPGSQYIKTSRVRSKNRIILPTHCQTSKIYMYPNSLMFGFI